MIDPINFQSKAQEEVCKFLRIVSHSLHRRNRENQRRFRNQTLRRRFSHTQVRSHPRDPNTMEVEEEVKGFVEQVKELRDSSTSFGRRRALSPVKGTRFIKFPPLQGGIVRPVKVKQKLYGEARGCWSQTQVILEAPYMTLVQHHSPPSSLLTYMTPKDCPTARFYFLRMLHDCPCASQVPFHADCVFICKRPYQPDCYSHTS